MRNGVPVIYGDETGVKPAPPRQTARGNLPEFSESSYLSDLTDWAQSVEYALPAVPLHAMMQFTAEWIGLIPARGCAHSQRPVHRITPSVPREGTYCKGEDELSTPHT